MIIMDLSGVFRIRSRIKLKDDLNDFVPVGSLGICIK